MDGRERTGGVREGFGRGNRRRRCECALGTGGVRNVAHLGRADVPAVVGEGVRPVSLPPERLVREIHSIGRRRRHRARSPRTDALVMRFRRRGDVVLRGCRNAPAEPTPLSADIRSMPGIRAVRRCRTQVSRVKAAKVLSKSAHVKIFYVGFVFLTVPFLGCNSRGALRVRRREKKRGVCASPRRALTVAEWRVSSIFF